MTTFLMWCPRYWLVALLLAQWLRAAAAPPYQLPTSEAGFRAELQRPSLPDTLRVICLNNLARFAQASDPPAAGRYVRRALALARRVGYRRGEANALLMQGSIATASNDALTSQTKTLAALRVFEQLGNRKGMASSFQALGSVAVLTGDHARALRYYLQADSTFRLLTPPCLWCELNARTNAATQQLALGHKGSALRTYRQVLAQTQGQDDSFAQIRIGALAGTADVLTIVGRPDSAVTLLQQGLALARRIGDQYLEVSLLNSLTACYDLDKLADVRQRERYARQAVRVGWASGQQQPLQVALSNLAGALHQLGRPAAYDTLLSYVSLNQQLQATERTQALADAQTRYDVAGQQATIRDLRKDRRLAAQQQELTRLRTRSQLAGLGGAAALLLLGAGFLFQRYRQRQAAARAAAETLLRQQIAADLHDDVGSLLTQVSLQSDLLSQGLLPDDQRPAQLQRMASTSREAVRHMSDVVWGLSQLGHAPTLGPLLDRMRDHAHLVLPPAGLDLNFAADPALKALPVPTALQQVLFLIFKEALHNAVKHGQGTTEVTVALRHEAGELELAIRNDGRAPAAVPTPRPGHGLANMPARAQAVGGSVRYEVGEGFGVVARLPLG